MKAPDKIYINGFSAFATEPVKDGIEYIRKDALMEWLNGKVYEHNEDRFDDGFNTALGQVIDKVNSL